VQADQVAQAILSLVGVLAVARLGGFLAAKAGQPPVLGELGAGVVLGNLALAGFFGLDYLKTDATIDAVSRIAVIVLLFHASVESTVGEMRKLGVAALLIASGGVLGSFLATWGVASWLLPASTTLVRTFIAASLCATSVGVTARVFRDLGHASSRTAHLILAAAVIDDVLALIVLAVMTASGNLPVVLLKAAVFLIGGLAAGMFISPRLLSFASKSMSVVLLAAALAFCFAMAGLAAVFGLAPIVGAFAAGLAIEEWHYQDFIDRRERTLDDLITPLASWLVPIFFVVVGLRTDLSGLARPAVIGLAASLTIAAIAGKQLCALGAGAADASIDRAAVSLGMMPRGEVTLIFANLGAAIVVAGKPLVGPDTFLALVLTVIATTMITPVALKWRLGVSTVPRRT
jgi:Kef-type K+ transport system membrane component KefB